MQETIPDGSPTHLDGVEMTIGSVSRATGIPANTLRTWERRYGFPQPSRTEGGQRLYASQVVTHLRLVSRALDRGHRPRQVLRLSMDELRALLGVGESVAQAAPPRATGTLGPWMTAVLQSDAAALDAIMLAEHARHGALGLLEERVAPFLVWLGEAWADGEIGVFQEHLASQRVSAFLAGLHATLAPASGPQVVCTTLPAEHHDLGLQMAAVVLALYGRRPLFLGHDTPLDEIAQAVLATGSGAVILSLSAHMTPEVSRPALTELRALLPTEVDMLVGGAGAPAEVDGVVRMETLGELVAWSS